jgi:hypothetical protein
MKRSKLKLLFVIGTVIVLVMAAATLISAQDNGESPDINTLIDSYTFRPITDIVDTDLIVTNFESDGTATLPLTTTVPVACTMVYGKTESFGSLTLDQNMAGGVHSEHNPLVSGLEPETTYYFRVQGVDVDGVVYLSDVMTFTTPAFDTAEVTNLASPEMGAEIVGYSSAFGGADINEAWGAGMAFDDSANSEWSSAGDGDNAWVEVKLAQRSRITRVEFWSRAMPDGSAIVKSFTITTDSGDIYGPFELPDTEQAYDFDVDIEADTLRFDVASSTGGNTGAVEIAVYGEPVE